MTIMKFSKTKVAHQLRDDQIVDILKLVDFRTTKSEINSFLERSTVTWSVETKFKKFNGLIIHLRGLYSKDT